MHSLRVVTNHLRHNKYPLTVSVYRFLVTHSKKPRIQLLSENSFLQLVDFDEKNHNFSRRRNLYLPNRLRGGHVQTGLESPEHKQGSARHTRESARSTQLLSNVGQAKARTERTQVDPRTRTATSTSERPILLNRARKNAT